MYCSKCKFTSFDHLTKCPKCGLDWKETREALQLSWLQSEGYDWFKHAPRQAGFDAQDSPPHSDGLFSFSENEPEQDAAISPEAEDTAGNLPQSEEITFAGLSDEMQGHLSGIEEAHAASAPEGQTASPEGIFLQAEPELPRENGEIAVDMHSTSLEHPLEAAAEGEPIQPSQAVQGEDQATGQDDSRSTEDILTAWEIPDELIPQEEPEPSLSGDSGQTKEDQTPPDSMALSAEQESIVAMEIDYDFSAIEVETPPGNGKDSASSSVQDTVEEMDRPDLPEPGPGSGERQ